MPEKEQKLALALRQVYGSLMLNGPFAILVAHHGELIGLTDRIRLRPLTVGEKDDMVYFSSEESAIRLISPKLDRAWTPMGGEPVIVKLKTDSCSNQADKKAAVTP
jgi:glutamate synthase domain-containing protein 1